jgi:hypothetical protein
MRLTTSLVVLAACAASPKKRESVWRQPPDYKSESFKFPLDFAPTLAHRGVEDALFPPGMFDPKAPGYWSYVFAWRTEDAAALDADQLGAELTTYFLGLVTAVDDKHRIASTADIAAHATASGDGFDLKIHSYDAFTTAQPIDLVGHAHRIACGSGALWVFLVAREGSALRAQLDALAAEPRCQ